MVGLDRSRRTVAPNSTKRSTTNMPYEVFKELSVVVTVFVDTLTSISGVKVDVVVCVA